MTVTVETLEGLSRRMTLNLNTATIDAEVGKRLQKLAKTVRMHGFRPGKAPMKMVAARFGGEVQGEVLGEALHQAFGNAAQENKLAVAGYPQFSSGDNGAFIATFEVFPDIQVGDLSQIKVARPVVEVADADIDRTLEVLRKQRVQYHTVERAAQAGNRVHIDYHGQIDSEPFPGGEAKDFPVILGEGRTLPDFEGSLVGMKTGESKTFDVTFPADYFAKELAGKTATFAATVKSVHEAQLPEVDADFAASLGVHEGGMARLREEIADNLRREAKRRVLSKVKEQVLNGLMETTRFEVPGGLVAMERHALMEKAVSDLKARGMKEADIKLNDAVFEPQARRRVALGLLMDTIVKHQGIKIDDAKVRTLVDEFAQSYEDPTEVVSWYYQDPSRLKEARAMVLEEGVIDWALTQVQVTDEPTPLEKIMGGAA